MMVGKLDRLITIETNTPSQDSYGEPIASWSTLATVYAEKVKPVVAQRFTGEQDAGFKKVVWRIRYRSDVVNDNLLRINYDGQTYDVKGTIEVQRRHYLLLMTESVIV